KGGCQQPGRGYGPVSPGRTKQTGKAVPAAAVAPPPEAGLPLQEFSGTLPEQILCQNATQLLGPRTGPVRTAFEPPLPVRVQDDPPQGQPAPPPLRRSAERQQTAAPEVSQQGPFGEHRRVRGGIVELPEQRERLVMTRAALQAERPLP